MLRVSKHPSHACSLSSSCRIARPCLAPRVMGRAAKIRLPRHGEICPMPHDCPSHLRSRLRTPPMLNSIASAGRRVLPNQWDLIALAAIMAVLTAVAQSYHGISAPLPAANEPVVSLDYSNLPYYALRTALRMFAALFFSLVFTFTYATLAAKSRRAEMVLIPVLDILQSVPILGFLSFTVTFFLGLFPGSVLGAECAAVFVIFTSQAWNMAFSFYQSLRTVPT